MRLGAECAVAGATLAWPSANVDQRAGGSGARRPGAPGRVWFLGEVQSWIREQLGVEMKYHADYRLVRDKLGAKMEVPRPSHSQNPRLR